MLTKLQFKERVKQNFGSSIEKYKTQQKRDLLKIEACKNNDIPLLIIPYTNLKNIEDILHTFFY